MTDADRKREGRILKKANDIELTSHLNRLAGRIGDRDDSETVLAAVRLIGSLYHRLETATARAARYEAWVDRLGEENSELKGARDGRA